MWQEIRNAIVTLKQCLHTLVRYPVFLVPIAGVWVLYATVLTYFKFVFPWGQFDQRAVLVITAGIFLLKSSILALACLILLELIQQIESKGQINLRRAARAALGWNLVRTLPIIFVWTLLWFVMMLGQPLLSLTQRSLWGNGLGETKRAIGEIGTSVSVVKLLEKGMRMLVFLILPAIAWENQWPWSATKRGMSAISLHLTPFAAAFVLSDLVTYLILAPVVFLFSVKDFIGLHLQNGIWFWLLVYMALGWSFTLFIEQWLAAELYLWHMKWQKACQIARMNQQAIPQLSDIQPPSILDDVSELLAGTV